MSVTRALVAEPVRTAKQTDLDRPRGFWGWTFRLLKYGILLVLSVTYLLPFFWMFITALKDGNQIYVVPPIWIPNPAFWNNFWDAWNLYDFNKYLFNTVFKYALPATLGTVFSSALVAYGFARIRWKWRDVLFGVCLATMMIPYQVTMVPLFIIFKQFGWINTYLPLIVPAFFGSPYNIFLLRQFFMSIPQELSDAARIDGASEFGILFRILLPLSRPALTVIGLFSFMGAWNDYMGPLIYLSNSDDKTLALGIQSLRSLLSMRSTVSKLGYPYLMAVSTIVTAPIIIAFFFAQRAFIEGITLTGIKG